ncbi:hypothetical protein BKA64DRAFT_656489 [Cadophora sp. MPI-SDFR-AT-0126]|nr:hypothetical protein BKA64DRAFT_656489 [Leotiomycetes sp. MPI-SDFR-AT-0126]
MAFSTAHDVTYSRKQSRKRPDNAAWTMPGQKAPRFAISDEYGPSLEGHLVPLARALFSFDYELSRRVRAVDRKIVNTPDEPHIAEAAHRMSEYDEVKLQWNDIQSSTRQFSQSYLTNGNFVAIWADALRIIGMVLGSKKNSGDQIGKRKVFKNILLGYEKQANQLMEALIDVASDGALGEEVLSLIQERWIRLDETLDRYFDDEDSREHIPTWRNVHFKIKEVKRNASVPATGKSIHQPSITSSPGQGTQHAAAVQPAKDMKDHALILWLTYFCCAITSVGFYALGYSHSLHIAGSTNDPDFWFLMQGCVSQLLGLAASALLEWKSGGYQKWRWRLPMGIAVLCSVLATPLYVLVPTEWSSFLTFITSTTQSFILLQHFLTGGSS